MSNEVLADSTRLREARRERAFGAMAEHDIDVLFLGREANARYISGAPRLWTAGTRPYGPGCVVVRAGGAVHLVSSWDEGMPDDISHEHLFGITWNPGNLLAWLQSIEGVQGARRIGTDSLTPRFAQLLPNVFPDAEFVDAEPALEAARRIKTPEELELIGQAISVTEAALAVAIGELGPGVSERHLSAVFMESMAAQGITTPATQRVAWITSKSPPLRRSGEAVVNDGDLVAFDAGVVASGYIAEVGRTWPSRPRRVDAVARDLFAASGRLWTRLLDACQPGASCAGLLAAYGAEGLKPPLTPVAFGLGLGFDSPVVTTQLPRTAARELLMPGMVLAVIAQVTGETQAVVRKEVVHITAQGPELLSTSPHWAP
jgi:Xaa-Pro dipeptidase